MKKEQKTINEKKVQKINLDFSYYSENFKFYFTGFCIAVWIFIILFVLGIISFNKTPQLLNNPKTLYYIKDNWFWEINNQEEIESIPPVQKTILTSYPILYHIGENQIPNLKNNYYIIKKWSNNDISVNSFIKYLRLPEIKTNSFKDWKLENILFETGNWKYYISIDLAHFKIEVFSTKKSEERIDKEYTEKEIKKYIKSEIKNLWLTLKYYNEPLIQEDNEEEVILFYPKTIEDKEIWNSDNKQEGMTIVFDKTQWIIWNIFNYDAQPYQLSKYYFPKTKNDLLENLKKYWNIDITKKYQEWTVPMQKWEYIYLDQWEYMVPALLFKTDTNIEKNIILPLY